MEVFSAINTGQVIALMLHDEMADLFGFLGLYGFKELHERQYLYESLEHRALKTHFLRSHGVLLPSGEITSVGVIPKDWYKYTQGDVSASIRKQAIQTAFETYKAWETNAKELYEKCAHYLLTWGKISEFNHVNELVCSVSKELEDLEQMHLELKAVDFDMEVILPMQESLRKKYKKRKPN